MDGVLQLGLISYVWWGSRRDLAGRLDHLFMETHTLALSVLFLSLIMPEAEVYVVAAATAFCLHRAATFDGRAALLNTSVAAYLTGLAVIYYCGGPGKLHLFNAGFALTLGSFVPKVADASQVFRWGTSIFHYGEAAGFVSFFLWAQAMPALL